MIRGGRRVVKKSEYDVGAGFSRPRVREAQVFCLEDRYGRSEAALAFVDQGLPLHQFRPSASNSDRRVNSSAGGYFVQTSG